MWKTIKKTLVALLLCWSSLSIAQIYPQVEPSGKAPVCSSAYRTPQNFRYIPREISFSRIDMTIALSGIFFVPPTGSIKVYANRYDARDDLGWLTATALTSGNNFSAAVLTFNVPAASQGTSLWITYSGDSTYCSIQFPVAIPYPPARPTTTSLTALNLSSGVFNPTTVFQGSLLRLLAEAKSGASLGTDGTVQFFNGANLIGQTPLDAAGIARIDYTPTSPGTYNFNAAFIPSNPIVYQNSASANVKIDVPEPFVLYSPSGGVFGKPISFNAKVNSSNLSGVVTFKDGATVLGTVATDATGFATFKTSSLSLGMHSIIAEFTGNASVGPRTSPSVNMKIYNAKDVRITPIVGSFLAD